MSEVRIDVLALNDLLRRASAEQIMPRFRRLGPGSIRSKSSVLDLVTDADVAAEATITAELLACYPDALVVGEEAAAADPGLIDGIADADLAFIVDPIDGTSNFAAGIGLFGVMLAVVQRNEVIAGIIYDPVADDSAIAVRGEGAWLQDAAGNRTRLRAAPAAPLELMRGSWSWRYFPRNDRPRLIGLAAQMGNVFDFRCAAHHYRMIAAGHSHFSLYHRLLPWDHAAGWLLHSEAGGHGAMLDGSRYRPSNADGAYLCAPDRECWEEICGLITG